MIGLLRHEVEYSSRGSPRTVSIDTTGSAHRLAEFMGDAEGEFGDGRGLPVVGAVFGGVDVDAYLLVKAVSTDPAGEEEASGSVEGAFDGFPRDLVGVGGRGTIGE